MADPTKYTVSYDFSGFQALNPSTPLPAPQVDVQFDDIATSIDEIVEALKEVRRADGTLQNGVVTIESLSSEVVTRFQGASAYDLAVEEGFEGSESEWLESLNGEDGEDGDPGAAATIAVGTVTTLAPGSSATVTNVGTSAAAIFDIAIPRGNPGADGDGSGDMVAVTYDPQNIVGDAFSTDNHTDGTTNKVFTALEKTKLTGIATGATANSADATLLARANHTGEQAISTVTGLQTALDDKLEASDIADVLETSDIGVTVQGYDADTLKADTDDNLTAGFTATAVNDGTKTTGTYTPVPTGGNLKRAVNGGAHTLAAPSASGDYTIVIQYTNDGSAGAIATSGFSRVTGDSFTTTNGHDFLVFITKLNGFTHAHVVALQ